MAENMLFVFPSVNMEFKYLYSSVLSDIMNIKFSICLNDTVTLESYLFSRVHLRTVRRILHHLAEQSRAGDLLKRETNNEWTFDAIVCRYFNNINGTQYFVSLNITQLLRKSFQRERPSVVEMCRGRWQVAATSKTAVPYLCFCYRKMIQTWSSLSAVITSQLCT
jgi:hypothetical protein